ncbi:MAG: hypothetical protein WBW93_16900 [Steroidobacteraceae bacterium]
MAAVSAARPLSDSTATDAVRQALDLLGRASADWRNGNGCEAGPLHWPVSVNLARRVLRQALEDLEPRLPGRLLADDERAGMAWFNCLPPAERRHWREIADSAVPADAWCAFQAGGSQP